MVDSSLRSAPRGCCRAPCKRLLNNGLSFLLNLLEVALPKEALGINLVDLFRAGRTGREPAVLRDYLNAANRVAISRSHRKNLLDLLARNFSGMNISR